MESLYEEGAMVMVFRVRGMVAPALAAGGMKGGGGETVIASPKVRI